MQGITPHLWFDREAVEAAEFYCATVPESQVIAVTTLHDTLSGDVDVVSFELAGQPFMAISAGPLFRFNPSVSFLLRCATVEEAEGFWAALADGGTPLMPLGSYPFSERYGWTQDRYGLSWQVMYDGGEEIGVRVVPTLMFVGGVCGKAEEAIRFYTSVFPHSRVGEVLRYAAADEPDVAGTVKHASFLLAGQEFAAMDSAHEHDFAFNEAIALTVRCDTQEEIDACWERLSAVPEAEQCGWLKDRYGVSWQVVPARMDEMLRSGTAEQIARVTQAFLAMKKFDVAALERAYGTTGAVGAQAP